MNDIMLATARYLENLNSQKPGAPVIRIYDTAAYTLWGSIKARGYDLVWSVYAVNPDCCGEQHYLILTEQYIIHKVALINNKNYGVIYPVNNQTIYDWNDPQLLNKLTNLISPSAE